jgi:ATP-dependent DNA helicase RecQ
VDITLEAQKIFSCIKRMQERYGLSTVAKVLKGSKNKRIMEWRLDRIPTYGIMSNHTEKEIYHLCQMLTAEGYLDIQLSNQSLPIAKLTLKAIDVLKGGQTVSQRRKILKDQPKQTVHTHGLFESLKMLRKQISEQEKLPPYMIFHDKTLKEMSVSLPQSERAMLEINGVGERKYHKYGSQFLTLIQNHIESNPPTHFKKTNPR